MRKKIKYGKFERDEWHMLYGLDDPNIQKLFDCIDFMDWSEYQLWVHGGIMMNKMTGDLDLTITGPYQPDRINFMLETIVACGFAHGVYVDVKYLVDGEIFDYQTWLDEGYEVCNLYATYKPVIQVNGINFEYGTEMDGLWVAEQCHPMKKVAHLNVPSPIRLY